MWWIRTFQLAVALTTMAGELPAQSTRSTDDTAVASFATAVREATARYQDQATAIGDGYRRIGPDFPSMGEHWVSIPLVVSGTIDPEHPPILEYATLRGRPTLVGVAYTQLLSAGSPAALVPASPDDWHYHAGTVDEESFILGHAGTDHEHPESGGPRIAVLHAWVWADNPAGFFATDNWALPYLRLGLPVPLMVGPTPASFALALAAGGEAYFRTLLQLRHHPSPEQARAIQDLLARQAAAIREEVASGRPPEAEELTRLWVRLERSIRESCPSCGDGSQPLFGPLPEIPPAN